MIIRKIDNKYIIKILSVKTDIDEYYDQEKISNLFKKIILKIKEKDNISGLLDIDVYVNKNYGTIIEIECIYPYLDEIDMHIHFYIDTPFLMELNEFDLKNKKEIYYYDNKYYAPYHKLSDSIIIYKSKEILEKGIKIV